MSFISRFLSYTSEAESPTSFFKWAVYTAVGAILRDNCYVETTEKTIYPNLYTILLSSKSSATRKTLPMHLAFRLVRGANNTHIISGRASLPGIVKVLQSSKTNENGYRVKGASGFLFSQELTAFLYKDSDTLDQITDWHDFHEEWPVTLSGDFDTGGVKYLKNLCISLLGATNDENIPELYGIRAQKGGLLARTIIVRESKRRHIKSYLEGESLGDFAPFIEEVQEFSKLKGKFILDPDAREEHISWYKSITDDKISSIGIEGRIQTHALKVSMILAVCESGTLQITLENIQQGIDECVRLLPNYKILSQTVAVHQNVKVGALLLKELLMAKDYTLSIKQLLQRLWVEGLDKEQLDKMLATYIEAGLVESGYNQSKQESYVILTEQALIKYEETIKDSKGE